MSASYQPAERGAPRPKRTMWLTLSLGLIAFVPFAAVFMQSAGRDTAALVLSEGDEAALRDGLRVLSPSFTGQTPSGEPFVVTADWALPDSPNPDRVALKGIEATVTLEGGRVAIMAASDGAFFPKIEQLRLEKGVSATTSDGYRLDTRAATVDAKARSLRTDGPVTASGPAGTIRADMLEALDGADRIVKFVGNVHVTFRPDRADSLEIVPE